MDSFQVTNTRSFHQDTDIVTLTLKVGNQEFGPVTKSMGDLNNGDFPVNLIIDPGVTIDSKAPVVFSYKIENKGHETWNISPDCDGTVAEDTVSTTGAGLAGFTEPVTKMFHYPTACRVQFGQGYSDYAVTWSAHQK